MTEPRTEPTAGELRARAQAAVLLGRAHASRASTERAAANAATSGARSRLADAIAGIASAEIQLATAIDTPAANLSAADLAHFEALLQGSERAAETAIQAADTEAAGAAADDIATVTATTRREVQSLSRDLFERRIFDPYLHFDSPEEKARYEAEQAARQRQIEAALAEHTPGGDLRAGGLAAGGMLEAAGHGAAASPDFLPRWNKLVAQLHAQEAAAKAAGDPQAIESYKTQLRHDIRKCLQKRGVPEDQIRHVLASDDPLNAVTPYLDDHLISVLEKNPQLQPQAEKPPQGQAHGAAAPPHSAASQRTRTVSLAALEGNSPSLPDAMDHGLSDSARAAPKTPDKGSAGRG